MNNRGFTMIEAVIVIVILGVVALMGFSFVGSSANTYVMVTAEGKVTSEVYTAMNRITRELQFSDVSTVTVPNANTLSFTTITNNFPAGWNLLANCANCQDHSTSITYSLAGGALTRTTALGAQTLADGVTTFSVTMTTASRATIVGGLGAATTVGSNVVQLNAADTITPGQATNLLLTVGGQTVRITNYIPANFTGTVSPVWTATAAAGAAYTLSAKYLTITITKADATSGATVMLTQSVYPNPNFTYPVK